MKKIFVLASLITVFAVSASAQQANGRIERQRIEQGFNSGALTRPERFHLQQQEFRYQKERRRALRDGRISRHERRRLERMKRHERREIYRMKHNRYRRSL